jgi:hypothetical protein
MNLFLSAGLAMILVVAGAIVQLRAQAPVDTTTSVLSPAQLPGKGLGQHAFLYAGESHDRRIFIVREGKIAWSYDDPAGKGEISDAVMLSNGNILFAHQFGVTEITQEKKVVWNYVPAPGNEVHTAVPIGNDRVLYIQNGDPALLRVVNLVTGITEKEINLEVKRPVSVHAQFRYARLTSQGTLLVASLQQAWRLPNGNTLVNNWVNEWNKSPVNDPGTLQALEVTPAKQVVWALSAWTPPANLGPATTIQLLDEASKPEDVHFGEIH